MKLIDDWKKAWRFWSVRLSAAGVALLSFPDMFTLVWNQVPADLRAALPYSKEIALALIVASLVARIVKQEKLHG